MGESSAALLSKVTGVGSNSPYSINLARQSYLGHSIKR
jgi:hypothetical protein